MAREGGLTGGRPAVGLCLCRSNINWNAASDPHPIRHRSPVNLMLPAEEGVPRPWRGIRIHLRKMWTLRPFNGRWKPNKHRMAPSTQHSHMRLLTTSHQKCPSASPVDGFLYLLHAPCLLATTLAHPMPSPASLTGYRHITFWHFPFPTSPQNPYILDGMLQTDRNIRPLFPLPVSPTSAPFLSYPSSC